jgi:S1-C subfamily serine protease
VAASSRARDLALIEAKCPALTPLPLAQGEISPGGRLSLIRPARPGSPESVVSGVGKGTTAIQGMAWVQSNVEVRPGDEGGPLLDFHGNVVAVISRAMTAKSEDPGLSLFVPVDEVTKYLPIDFE